MKPAGAGCKQWWNKPSAPSALPARVITEYQAALASRFVNPRIRYLLAQVAHRRLGEASRPRPAGAPHRAGRWADCRRAPIRVLAAWVCHLRGLGAPISDPRATDLTAMAAASPRRGPRGPARPGSSSGRGHGPDRRYRLRGQRTDRLMAGPGDWPGPARPRRAVTGTVAATVRRCRSPRR